MCRCEVAQDTESRLDEDVRRCLISAAGAATSLASRFFYIFGVIVYVGGVGNRYDKDEYNGTGTMAT